MRGFEHGFCGLDIQLLVEVTQHTLPLQCRQGPNSTTGSLTFHLVVFSTRRRCDGELHSLAIVTDRLEGNRFGFSVQDPRHVDDGPEKLVSIARFIAGSTG